LGPLAVDPNHQGLGIGQALVKAGLDRLKNQGANGCVVVEAKAFYERFGFAQHEGLKLGGIPPEYFMAMIFAEILPRIFRWGLSPTMRRLGPWNRRLYSA